MIDTKRSVLGVCVDTVDYDLAVDRVMTAVRDRTPFAATALAVHGVMTGVLDGEQRYRLNHLDLVTPDGQPVRWALNWLYKAGLTAPAIGTELTRRLLARAADEGLPVYFYGSVESTLELLSNAATKAYPKLEIAGCSPSMFRPINQSELSGIARAIEESGARIVFVGLGCPRQETFAFHMKEHLAMPLIAVGAAFDYIGGTLKRPPARLSRMGLEWLWRLGLEPRRLWRRYVLLNPRFLASLLAQYLGVKRFDAVGQRPTDVDLVPA